MAYVIGKVGVKTSPVISGTEYNGDQHQHDSRERAIFP